MNILSGIGQIIDPEGKDIPVALQKAQEVLKYLRNLDQGEIFDAMAEAPTDLVYRDSKREDARAQRRQEWKAAFDYLIIEGRGRP